jgi:hypothetical protein
MEKTLKDATLEELKAEIIARENAMLTTDIVLTRRLNTGALDICEDYSWLGDEGYEILARLTIKVLNGMLVVT